MREGFRPYGEAVSALLADQARLADAGEREEDLLTLPLLELGREMNVQGCFDGVRAGERALWGIDGGLARRRRFGDVVVLLAVAAAPAEGRPRAKGELLRFSHDPSGEILVRARLSMEELIAAGECAGDDGWTLLDGSFSSGLVAVRQAVDRLDGADGAVASLVFDRLPLWIETLEKLARGRGKIAALPKLTAGSLLRDYLDLPFPVSDRALLSKLLPPGMWIDQERLEAFLDLPRKPLGRLKRRWPLERSLAERLEEAASAFALSLRRASFRPLSGGTAVEIETTGDPSGAVSALWDQFPSRRLKEPLLLVAADEAVKGLSRLLGREGEEGEGDSYRSPR
ncbi:MAG: hypothetical protein PHF19_07145 [Synergistales bacterium]|nr:hypothetical protein [Synergistales bacterium]